MYVHAAAHNQQHKGQGQIQPKTGHKDPEEE